MAVSIKEKVKTIFTALKEPGVFNALISLRHSGYLVDVGWFNSFKNKSSVDKNNKPIPWVTYPFIDFISERLHKELSIFEFGAGNSTLYYADKVKFITSIEHNKGWYEKLSAMVPGNVNLIYKELDEEYSKSALNSGKKFDIIIVDAEDRVKCVYNSFEALSEKGIIILDDSERKEYEEGVDFLKKNNFKQLSFSGIAPSILFKKCTSIFYKENNCIGI